MKERPALFNGEMVRRILDGSKTQTRRVVKDATGAFWDHAGWRVESYGSGGIEWRAGHDTYRMARGCPHGDVGDRLYVRETWGIAEPHPTGDDDPRELPEDWERLSERTRAYWLRRLAYRATAPDADVGKWMPSIHMKRWMSRIDLEITGVRVERLQDISEEDARAEGVRPLQMDHGSYVPAFEGLWCSINGAESWKANAWVWVISFVRAAPPTDGGGRVRSRRIVSVCGECLRPGPTVRLRCVLCGRQRCDECQEKAAEIGVECCDEPDPDGGGR